MEVLAGSTDVTTYFNLRLAADGTAATALTISELDLQYTRSGATPAAKVDATALAATDTAHTDNRAIEIDATDQPGLYRVDWPDAAFAAGVREVILTVKHSTTFIEHLRVNLTPVPANVTQFGSTNGTFASGIPEVKVASMANNSITAAAAATDFGAEIQALITGGAYTLATDANGRIRIVDGTGAGELDTASGVVIARDHSGAALATAASIAALNNLSTSDVDARLAAIGLDHLLSASVTGTDVADNSIIAKLVSKSSTADWDSFTNTTDALEALRDRGDAAWITATGFSTHSASDVWAVATRVLTAGTNIALAKGTGVTGFNDLSTADVRTAIGLASANLDTQLDALPTANEVRNAVTGGAYALSTDSNGMVRIVDGTGTGEIDTTSGGVLVSALSTTAKSHVNTEVVDGLTVDTYAEPSQGTPAATASLSVKLGWLYAAWRNKKTQTSSEQKLFGDDATTVVAKSSLSDDGSTLTIGEFATGP